MPRTRYPMLILLALLLAACGPPARPDASALELTALAPAGSTEATAAVDSATVVPTAVDPIDAPPAPSATAQAAGPTAIPETAPAEPAENPPAAPATSFEPALYQDAAAGIELSYPAEWGAPVPVQQGERGSIVQLSQDGAPRLDIAVLRWDPTNDLAAYVANRKLAWEASGFSVTSEETYPLADGRQAARFIVRTSTGELAFFFFTPVGDSYLALSGGGDLELLTEISSTVRPLGAGE